MSTVFMVLWFTRHKAEVIQPHKRTVIITGGNRGIGLAAAKQLAATNDWEVILACRSKELGIAAKSSFLSGSENVSVMELDLSDLHAVQQFAKKWGERRVDCLALNAGIHTGSRLAPLLSVDGHELTIATNHVGHFYLTELLRKNIELSKNGRIVYVSSSLHNSDGKHAVGKPGPLGDFSGLARGLTAACPMIDGSRFNSDKAYQDSKLCNVMTTLELAHQLQAAKSSVTCNCMSPGLIPTTGLFREYNAYLVYLFNFAMTNILQVAVTEEEGGRRLAYMIASPDLEGKTGLYFARNPATREFEQMEPLAAAKNPIDRARLWNLTQALLDKKQ